MNDENCDKVSSFELSSNSDLAASISDVETILPLKLNFAANLEAASCPNDKLNPGQSNAGSSS